MTKNALFIRFQKIMLVLVVTTFITATFAQEWKNYLPKDKTTNGALTLFDYQKAFNQYWDAYDVVDGYYTLNGEKQKAYGWKQFRRWEWYWESRIDPVTGAFPDKSALEVFTAYNAGRNINTSSGDWTSMGPNSTSGGYAGLGRLNCIGFHPTDDDIFYVGAAAGGVWKTIDGGSNWNPISDSIAALGISDIKVVVDGGIEIIYIATGDRDASDTYSVGVLKSTNGGDTWNTTGLNWTQNQYRLINRLLIDPNAPDTLYAATNIGLYQTFDGGDNWTLKTGNTYIDIEFQPGNTAQLYGSNTSGGIYRSSDYGGSWSSVMNISGGQRTEIAVTDDNSSIVYAIVANNSNGLYGIYKSTNNGGSFSQVFSGSTANMLGWNCNGGDSGGQGWYDLCIEADPNDEDVVFVGGVNTWKSANGGSSWSISNHWSGTCGGSATNVHADKHFLAYQNGSSTLFECNDGGLYKTGNGGSSWTHLGSGLVISQIYRLGVAQTVNDDVIAGLQDNGTKALLSNSWYDVIGGDGMDCLIDYTDEDIQYGSLYYGKIYRTTNHWASDTRIDDNGISESGAWVTPYCLDRNDNETIYTGFKNVWESTNQGNSWTKISTWGGSSLRSIAAGYDSDYIYAATYNTMYMTSDGGANWSNISSGLPSSSIKFISVKDDDPNTVWVAFSGFNGHSVYETTNGGSSWTNISAGLPELPTNCVIQDTSSTNIVLYAGTDVGIYIKDGSNNWAPFYEGLPNVVVTELEIYYDNNNAADSRIRAATYGRGVWESELYSTILAPESDFSASNTAPYVSDTIAFTDLSTNSPTSWVWDINPNTYTFVDGTGINSQNPHIRFDAEDLYTVSLTTSNAGGSDTETKTDYISVSVLVIAPVCDFEADTIHPSVVDTVSFTDLSANVPYSWNWEFDPQTITFLDGTSENSQNPKVRFDQAGIYTVILNVENSAGSDMLEKTNYLTAVDLLSLSITADPETICESASSQLYAAVEGGDGGYAYSWTSNPAGFTSDVQNPIVEPEVNTTYFVEVTDGLQTVSDDVMVIVNSLPEITLGEWPDLLCNEEEPPVQLSADPENGIYSGDNITAEGVFTPEDAVPGWHVIAYTYEDGCVNSAQDSIFVDQCVGVDAHKFDQSGLIIYPNPNNGKFVIESDATIETVELFNQLGKLIYTEKNNNNKLQFNTDLDKGIYYLKAKLSVDGQEVWITKKVLIN